MTFVKLFSGYSSSEVSGSVFNLLKSRGFGRFSIILKFLHLLFSKRFESLKFSRLSDSQRIRLCIINKHHDPLKILKLNRIMRRGITKNILEMKICIYFIYNIWTSFLTSCYNCSNCYTESNKNDCCCNKG